MRFEKSFSSREHHYSLAVELNSETHYLAIPVSNQLIDYLEYYRRAVCEFEAFRSDPSDAVQFAESCRRRRRDERLFIRPGNDRGVPR